MFAPRGLRGAGDRGRSDHSSAIRRLDHIVPAALESGWNFPNSRKSVSAITLILSSICMFFLVGNQALALTRVGLEHTISFHCYNGDVIEN